MKKIFGIISFFLLMANYTFIMLGFSSCDPAYSVVLSNKSGVDRHIEVLYPESSRHFLRDSLSVFDNRIKASKRYSQKAAKISLISKDTLKRSYTFLLNSNFDVIVEGASFIGLPTDGQIFIIDNKDSITLKKNDKNFRRSWFIGGSWTYTIKNQE